MPNHLPVAGGIDIEPGEMGCAGMIWQIPANDPSQHTGSISMLIPGNGDRWTSDLHLKGAAAC